jgi:hypothetical protein
MARTLRITRNEIESLVPAKKLKHVLGPKSCSTVLLAALLLVGLSAAFSSPARAQETRQNAVTVEVKSGRNAPPDSE